MWLSYVLQRRLQHDSDWIAKVKKQLQNYNGSSNPLWKLGIWVFWIFWIFWIFWVFCYYFTLEAVLQGVGENNPTEKQIDAEIQATLKHAPV